MEVECPVCEQQIPVQVELGRSIMRACDKALLAHYAEEHP